MAVTSGEGGVPTVDGERSGSDGEIAVVVIDDNPGDVVIAIEALEEIGLRSSGAGSLEEGLVTLRADGADCVLLDVNLPDSNGLEGLEAVVAHAPDAAVVMLTGIANDDLTTRALRAGAQDYLLKDELEGAALQRAIRYAMDRKRFESELARRATRDELTGLYNRRELTDRLRVALARAARTHTHVGVAFLDLDHFKPVNDEFGHDVGDRVLVEVASRLTATCRETDVVGRIGGDEFVVVFEEITDTAEVDALTSRIVRAVEAPIKAGGHHVEVGASVGTATSCDGDSVESMLAAGDSAMYQAKRARTASRTAVD